MRRWFVGGGLALCAFAFGCHREIEMVPLAERTIYITDRFYDVEAVSKDHAVVVGYGGKILATANGGMTWEIRSSGVETALYAVQFTDDQHGWIAGQDGLILHTADGGKTWQPQESAATYSDKGGGTFKAYLFGLYALDNQRAWAVGDRSALTSTTDGGKTWRGRKVAVQQEDITGGESIAAADPVFYDVRFTDPQHGWIVGEFGKILRTEDGGETWREQQHSLMEGTGIFDPLDLPTLFGIHVRSPEAAVAAGLEAHLARTTDGGRRWTYDKIESGDVALVDPLFAAYETASGDGWAVGTAGQVVHKVAGETVWKPAQLGQDVLTWLRSVDFSDDQNGWMVGGYGLIFRTTDGGKSWLPSQG